jgi:hypothetical protein
MKLRQPNMEHPADLPSESNAHPSHDAEHEVWDTLQV